MSRMISLFIISTALIFTLGSPRTVPAVSTVTVTQTGDGVFVLRGSALHNVAAMDISVNYDISSLADPRMTRGNLISGALTAVNVNMPGTVRIGIVRTAPINGSGDIATLDFSRRSGSSGQVKTLRARLSSIDGERLPVSAFVNSPPDAEPDVPDVPREQQQADTSPGNVHEDAIQENSSAAGTGSVVFIPGIAGGKTGVRSGNPSPGSDIERKGEEAAETWMEATAYDESAVFAENPGNYIIGKGEKRAPAPDTATLPRFNDTEKARLKTGEKSIDVKIIRRSVLDRFKEYEGERTAMAYLSLFEPDGAAGFLQEPLIALADGISTVNVYIKYSSPDKSGVPNVEVAGGSLISVKRGPDGTDTWLVTLRPDREAHRTELEVRLEKIDMVLPLTVAPRRDIDLDKSGTITETDLALFFRENAEQEAPSSEPRAGLKRDSLNDFIFTANYLAARRSEKVKYGK